MRRINFNDGEGLTFEDLNKISQLADRNLTRRVLTSLRAAGISNQPGLMLWAGSNFSLSGSDSRTVTLTHGYYGQAETPADNDSPDIALAEAASASYQLDAATSGTAYRRDILEARIESESTAEAETRDFKDAVTGVVTTTSFNKRRRRLVTIQVKKGTDQVSENAANTNEPAVTAGFTKIYSFLVPPTGNPVSELKVWDWHVPGTWAPHFVPAEHIGIGTGSSITLATDGDFGFRVTWPNGVGGTVAGRCFPQRSNFGPDAADRTFNARLLAVRSLARVRNGSGGFAFTIRKPSDTGSTQVVSIAYTANASVLIRNTLFSLISGQAPIWMTGEPNRNRPFDGDCEGPLYFNYADEGDGTADARLFWAQFEWLAMGI